MEGVGSQQAFTADATLGQLPGHILDCREWTGADLRLDSVHDRQREFVPRQDAGRALRQVDREHRTAFELLHQAPTQCDRPQGIL